MDGPRLELLAWAQSYGEAGSKPGEEVCGVPYSSPLMTQPAMNPQPRGSVPRPA